MNDREAFEFINGYFHDIFEKRDVDALDDYLHPSYRDDDIGSGESDHRKNSKRYLKDLFEKIPSVGVEVKKAMISGAVVCADPEWFTGKGDARRTWMKGIGIFVLKEGKIARRHTFVYSSQGENGG